MLNSEINVASLAVEDYELESILVEPESVYGQDKSYTLNF